MRERELKRDFTFKNDLSLKGYSGITILDDVITTGATLEAIFINT